MDFGKRNIKSDKYFEIIRLYRYFIRMHNENDKQKLKK